MRQAELSVETRNHEHDQSVFANRDNWQGNVWRYREIGASTLCWMQSDMSRRQNFKRRIIANRKSQLMQLDSRKHVSGNTGAIQIFIPWYWKIF
jgi:hypothetical protein